MHSLRFLLDEDALHRAPLNTAMTSHGCIEASYAMLLVALDTRLASFSCDEVNIAFYMPPFECYIP